MTNQDALSEHKLIFEIPMAAAPETAGLDVHVVFTNMAATLHALERAALLAKDLHVRLRLLVPQVVSYTLPLESPPVLVEFSESRFRRFAAHLGVDVHVEIYLCRDPEVMLAQRLAVGSVVVVGGQGRWWWPTREWRLARRLRQRGHEVALVSAE